MKANRRKKYFGHSSQNIILLFFGKQSHILLILFFKKKFHATLLQTLHFCSTSKEKKIQPRGEWLVTHFWYLELLNDW